MYGKEKNSESPLTKNEQQQQQLQRLQQRRAINTDWVSTWVGAFSAHDADSEA